MGSQRVGPEWATNTWAIWEIYLIFLNIFHVNRRYTCYKICMCFSLINLFWCTYILCLSQESRRLKEKLFLLPYKGFFWVSESFSAVSDSLRSHGLYSSWYSPGQNTGVSGLSLLQGIVPTQGSNPGLLHCRQFLHQLRYQGSPIRVFWRTIYILCLSQESRRLKENLFLLPYKG